MKKRIVIKADDHRRMKKASYKKLAGTWDLPLLINKIVEICEAMHFKWDVEMAANWLEKKYKNPINPDIRTNILQKAQEEIDNKKAQNEDGPQDDNWINTTPPSPPMPFTGKDHPERY